MTQKYPKISIKLLKQFGVRTIWIPSDKKGDIYHPEDLRVGLKGFFNLEFFDEDNRDGVERSFYCEVIE